MMHNILPMEDIEISTELTRSLTKAGIRIISNTKVEHINVDGPNINLEISNNNDHSSISADQVLVAIGFTPNTQGLGLETIGVEMDSQGFVKIDDRMSTNIDNVYAIGDVTGKLLLAHVASAQGIVVAETIAEHPTVTLTTKCYPELPIVIQR